MENIKLFLETSTIHGLSYISTTRRLVRIFWILIVMTGFTGAGILIYQSFQDWTDNPITTTIETVPIKEVAFPKITVCPPKNTFLDLNYYFSTVDNMTMTEKTNIQLLENFAQHFQTKDFETLSNKISLFMESNAYFNWYTA